jgi:hypothetical protein
MKRRRNIRLVTTIFMAVALAMFLPCLSIAGSLEPPASAVDGSGNPVPTMTTPPPWSQKLPVSERFELVLDGLAVLDKETGLVWEKSPYDISLRNFDGATLSCYTRILGGRKGWRLPTVEELASLVDLSVIGSPKLPSGSPFTNVPLGSFWSTTTATINADIAWIVDMNNGGLYNGYYKTSTYNVWCVRGGQGYDAY